MSLCVHNKVPAICPTCAKYAKMQGVRGCKTPGCTNNVHIAVMGDLCHGCSLPTQVQEIAEEHAELEVANEKPEYLTHDIWEVAYKGYLVRDNAAAEVSRYRAVFHYTVSSGYCRRGDWRDSKGEGLYGGDDSTADCRVLEVRAQPKKDKEAKAITGALWDFDKVERNLEHNGNL